ncbi:hypothetical protein DIC66_06535 [Rhodoferax lacus]|uniref:Uncharacterized protein n=1 Tax=Rhodoferax lacus TaxID=2184758 RepID=A0A3E1RDT7_9BURK|nr:hypothetical protein [Rhodoferax lacus]RFO97525.1 hypothetical protein DIC66_06535 [Rhodoferax lacus]
MTSPLTIDHAPALAAIRAAAQRNNATKSGLPLETYTAAGVTGAQSAFLSAYNSALDSAAVTGARADTTAEVQAIVDAYNTILKVTDGYSGVPIPVVSAAQYVAIGVTGVSGPAVNGTALHLLDDSLLGVGRQAADTVAELQARAHAANHVMAATGGNVFQSANLSAQDFAALGVTGVTAANLRSIRTVLRAVSNDSEVDTRYGLQSMVNAVLGTSAESAKAVILAEAEFNSANATTLSAKVYATAGVAGVDSSNLASINSAINSQAFDASSALHGLQPMVDAYNAILRSADGTAGNTSMALTGAQFSAVGVTGISNTATAAGSSALHLLDSVVDASSRAKVDTVPELQAMANAANHVMAAAGGSATEAATLSVIDMAALGVTGVTGANIAAVRTVLQAISHDSDVGSQNDLQHLVDATVGGDSNSALAWISTEALHNSANSTTLSASVYSHVGVHGVDSSNLTSINSVLNSSGVTGLLADTPQELQQIVDTYSAILQSADGVSDNTATPLTAAQWAAVGVDVKIVVAQFGLEHNLHLLNSVVDASAKAQVDTVPELQAIADAAHHVMSWIGTLNVGGVPPTSPPVPLTIQDLQTLGITGSYVDQMAAINTALQHTGGVLRTALDTQSELQSFVDYTVANGHGPAIPYPLDDQKVQVVTAVDPVVLTGIQHIVSTAVDPVVATAIEAVPVDPFFTGSCIDLRFTVCLFNTVAQTNVTPLEVGVATETTTPVWGCIFPPAQVTDIGTLVNPPVLAA